MLFFSFCHRLSTSIQFNLIFSLLQKKCKLQMINKIAQKIFLWPHSQKNLNENYTIEIQIQRLYKRHQNPVDQPFQSNVHTALTFLSCIKEIDISIYFCLNQKRRILPINLSGAIFDYQGVRYFLKSRMLFQQTQRNPIKSHSRTNSFFS